MNEKKQQKTNRKLVSTQRSESCNNIQSRTVNIRNKDSPKDAKEEEIKDDHLIDFYVNLHQHKDRKVDPVSPKSSPTIKPPPESNKKVC